MFVQLFSVLFCSLILSNNILFMWLILYFLILFISYCSVQYYSSSIYRYILVKKEHDVDHLGKFYVKRRAFIVFWNINCEMGFFNFIILFLYTLLFYQILTLPTLLVLNLTFFSP
uniref:Uncharacterized protein n=1 Tax=Aotus nancymaae TaxID=37293 RepID=A0A2K5C6F6_AOTNA